jgi:hypothetical protein
VRYGANAHRPPFLQFGSPVKVPWRSSPFRSIVQLSADEWSAPDLFPCFPKKFLKGTRLEYFQGLTHQMAMPTPLMGMARLQGFEPRACGLEVRCSIQLSYRRIPRQRKECEATGRFNTISLRSFCPQLTPSPSQAVNSPPLSGLDRDGEVCS